MSTQPNKKNNDWIWLPAMIICFACGLWPIALVILFWKIVNDNNKKTRKSTKTATQTAEELSKAADDLRRAATGFVDTVTGQVGKAAAGSASKAKAKPAAGKKVPGGTGLIIAGSIVSAIFGIGTMGAGAEFMESLMYGYFFTDELVGTLFCLAALVAGLILLCAGIGKNRRRDRWLSYLGYIGANRQVDLAHMAAAFDVSVRQLCNDLRKMLAEKLLPNGYLDLAAGKLILSEMGYQAPPKAAPKEEPKAEPEAAQSVQDDNAILAEIRAVNDAIPDPVMSEKIDRIGEITGKILDYQRRNPGKDSQLRSFLNYYLPTTLKILRSYAQLDAQGVEGENITAAKKRIEGMMDKVVEGFETQLDKLFADSAMDISSDVAVLEQMLEKDGLSSQSGSQMRTAQL